MISYIIYISICKDINIVLIKIRSSISRTPMLIYADAKPVEHPMKFVKYIQRFILSGNFILLLYSLVFFPCTTWHVLSYYYMRLRIDRRISEANDRFHSSTLSRGGGEVLFAMLLAKLCTKIAFRV